MKTKTKLSFADLLKQTKRIQYTDDSVVATVEPHEAQELEFFFLGKYVTDSELEEAYVSRGLEAAHPYALALYSLEYEAEMDEKKYVATHWKDADDKWCYAAFGRWLGERYVDVGRDDGEWDDDWWFAGVRKSSPLASDPSSSSAPVSLDLSSAIKMVKDAGYKIIKEL